MRNTSSCWRRMGLVVMGAVVAAAAGCTQEKKMVALAGVGELKSVKELPNPFVFNDGSAVKSRSDWEKRRGEIREAVLFYEYGQMPGGPGNVKGKEISLEERSAIGAVEKQVELTMGPGVEVATKVIVTMPKGKGPFPVIICGDMCWGRVKEGIVGEVVRRGYALVEFDRTDFAPDKNDRTKGALAAYPGWDWAAISAWAWGYHRVVDYLEKQDFADAKRIAITGHSRGGKAALLAGATDERIALTNPNNSGCGGAGCYRFQAEKSEDIGAITKNFPFWFVPRFREFIGRVDLLPFDQHSVKALVAPRALLQTEALEDLWANPEGTQATHMAAKEVYRFLGAEDRIGIYFRDGKHEHNEGDWEVLLDFADQQFFGKASYRNYVQLAFWSSAKRFSWTAPK